MSNPIQLNQLSKFYETSAGRFSALKNITITIDRGEYIAIVGKSGSGKSTLLNMLTGIDHPDEGSVIINNQKVHSLSENDLATWRGKNIGIVFQFLQLIPTLSILENILLAMEFVNVIPKKDRVQRAEALLEQVGITPHKNKFPTALSGGEQQRAAIARALANDPPILVADEPTGNLDSKTTEVILKLFAELIKLGKTVIVVTHDTSSATTYSRIITIKDGEIIEDTKNQQENYDKYEIQKGLK